VAHTSGVSPLQDHIQGFGSRIGVKAGLASLGLYQRFSEVFALTVALNF
jgi:hypothetical protein